MKRYVIVVAGGKGLRMGAEKPKQFLEIGDKAILLHTMEKFLAFDRHIKFVTVLAPEYFEFWREYCREHGFTGRQSVVPGGLSRFHSVQNAVRRIAELEEGGRASAGAGGCASGSALGCASGSAGGCASGSALGDVVVAVHDGVRPLVSAGLIGALFGAVEGGGVADCGFGGGVAGDGFGGGVAGAIPVFKIADSLCQLDPSRLEPLEGEPLEVPRDKIFAVQTPQIFRGDVLAAAYELPFRESFTDDASVVREWIATAGHAETSGQAKQMGAQRLLYVPGEQTNIKITTPGDLMLAEKLL